MAKTLIVVAAALALFSGNNHRPARVSVLAAGPSPDSAQKGKFRHKGSIATEYNKKTNETKVLLRRMPIYYDISSRYMEIEVTAYFTYQGKTPAKPQSFVLGFVSVADYQWFIDFHDLNVKVDGEVLRLGATELIKSENMPSDERRYKEVMAIELSYQTFLRITNGRRVHMELGRTRFDVPENNLEALRDLASRAEVDNYRL